MSIKLDIKDKKLLALLEQNARYSNSQLGKKIRLSKPAVEYRLQRLIDQKTIFNFYTLVNFNALGYSAYKLYFKLQDATLEDETAIVNYWLRQDNVVWVASLRGRWDVAVTILASSNNQFGQILSRFMNSYAHFILEKDVFLVEYSPMYLDKQDFAKKEYVYGVPTTPIQLDHIDHKILKELSKNSRMHIVDLAVKTKLSRDIITYRIKKMLKEKTIIAFKIFPDYVTIGKNFYKLIIRTKNIDERLEKALKEYSSIHRSSPQFIKLIGSFDIEIELITDTEDELYRILADIRKKFSSIIREYDIIRIIKTYKYDFYPF